jgi:hypothetical protein
MDRMRAAGSAMLAMISGARCKKILIKIVKTPLRDQIDAREYQRRIEQGADQKGREDAAVRRVIDEFARGALRMDADSRQGGSHVPDN